MAEIFYLDKLYNSPALTCRLVDANDPEFTLIGIPDDKSPSLGASNSFTTVSVVSNIFNQFKSSYDVIKDFGLSGGGGIMTLATQLPNIMKQGYEAAQNYAKTGKFSIGTSSGTSWNPSDLFSSELSAMFNNKLHTFDEWLYKFDGTTFNYPEMGFSKLLITDKVDVKRNTTDDVYFMISKYLAKFTGKYLTIGDAIGVQTAPSGFTTEMKGLREVVLDSNTLEFNKEDIIKGTYTFVLGDPTNGGLKFPGVVVNSLTFNFSESKVKISDGTYRPTFIECKFGVQIVQRPSRGTLLSNFTYPELNE